MKLQISISEITKLIATNTGKIVNFNILNANTISVNYDMTIKVPILGEISKNICINVQIEKIENEVLYALCFAEGKGLDLILKGGLLAIPSLFTSRIIEPIDESHLKVRLREIEKMRQIMDKVTINGITFADESIFINFELKSEA